jgi:nucleoside-diphosphate-sugar epimerase
MHKFITNAINGKDIEIYGDPQTKTLDFTYIDDFIDATMLVLKEKNGEYDISGGNEFNIYQLAEFIIAKTGSKSKIKTLPEEKAQPQKVKLDLSAIKALGYKPKISTLEGTKRTIEWYKDYLKDNS